MQRSEAAFLLREIASCCLEARLSNFVLLKAKQKVIPVDSEDFELHIRAEPDEESRRKIASIVDKHNLEMAEKGGFLIFCTRRDLLLEAPQ